ncbi:hypothetical protein [uncultured Sphingomonas sp.]|uniref:hypothetical protein n=1 Tax=uncultured Sphingomonas sp. TaxID=158754 RepID=UPI0035C97B22
MTIKGLFAAAAGLALVTATTATAAPAPAANPAAKLSVVRAGAPSAHGSKLGAAVPTGTLISIGILAALVVIVVVATDKSDSN